MNMGFFYLFPCFLQTKVIFGATSMSGCQHQIVKAFCSSVLRGGPLNFDQKATFIFDFKR